MADVLIDFFSSISIRITPDLELSVAHLCIAAHPPVKVVVTRTCPWCKSDISERSRKAQINHISRCPVGRNRVFVCTAPRCGYSSVYRTNAQTHMRNSHRQFKGSAADGVVAKPAVVPKSADVAKVSASVNVKGCESPKNVEPTVTMSSSPALITRQRKRK